MGYLSTISRKKSWSRPRESARTTSKAGIHRKKVLSSVWWDYKGIVYFELLPPNRTINSVVYIELTKLNNAVKKKRPELTNRKGVVFHHDNARPHTSLVKIYWSLIGMFCHIHHIVLTLHHPIFVSIFTKLLEW